MASGLSALRATHWASATLALAAVATGWAWQSRTGGSTLAFAWATGLLLGFVFQRSRFCFYCHARDWFAGGDPRGMLAIVLALAVGLVGTTVVLGSWLPAPVAGNLPPDMHIGPVGPVLVAAGLAFGAGMVVSGSCISAHWYRLAEGSPTAPFALLGTALGFLAGFQTWNALYSASVADAPIVWLPAHLGYGGALLLQLGVLALLAAWLWRGFGKRSEAADIRTATPTPATNALDQARIPSLGALWRRAWQGRWPYWSGGLAVGLIGAFTIVRMRPLGVTALLGSRTREVAQAQGWAPERLNGLDGFAGCATLPGNDWLTPNAVLLFGLVAGAFVAALGAGQFRPRKPTGRDAVRGLAGGVLLGWGAMTGLGCTIGTLLSGTMAGALSGWVFGASMFTAIAAWAWLQRRRGPAAS